MGRDPETFTDKDVEVGSIGAFYLMQCVLWLLCVFTGSHPLPATNAAECKGC